MKYSWFAMLCFMWQESDCYTYLYNWTYIHIYTYIFVQIPFPYRLLENIEFNSLWYTIGLWWLSIIYIYIHTHIYIYICVCIYIYIFGCLYLGVYFCFIYKFICIIFFLDSTYKPHHTFVFLSDLLSMFISRSMYIVPFYSA